MTGIILASSSPRREQLLAQLGLDFTVMTSGVDEDNEGNASPEQLVRAHALTKAKAVSERVSVQDIVIGADTVVSLDGVIYGKPVDEADACRILAALAGQTHSVWSGIAVIVGGQCRVDAVETRVSMSQMSAAQIERYVASKEPLDKAGAYAIQGKGAIWVERIDGCYFNVVGLPLHSLARILISLGVVLP